MHNRRDSLARHFQGRRDNDLPRRYSTQEVTEGQATVLANVYGPFKSPSVQLSQDAGYSERAARNHLSGANAMNLTDFFNACLAIPELRAWGARMMGLEVTDPLWQAECERLGRAYYQLQASKEREQCRP